MKQRSTNFFFRLLFTLLFLLGLNACGGGGGGTQTTPTLPPAPIDLWTWMSGSDVTNQAGVYGTQGTADAANIPGGREGAASWMDSSGNFWLFGGYGYDSAGTPGRLNDLWKFDGTHWSWISGNDVANQSGVYGTKGTADAANAPGGRSIAVRWTDSGGNLWLFGGYGRDSVGTQGHLNDLWKFDGTNWTWVSGNDLLNQAGVYGTQGTADAANIPGGREGAASWMDSSGNFWLFGGYGYDSAGTLGRLNDLWKFDGTHWSWVNGGDVINQAGIYGTQGIADVANRPGARNGAISWSDSSGNLWLYGGYGYDSVGVWKGENNDLWKFDGANWTWVSGNDLLNQAGVYGTQGMAAAANMPGGRDGAASWLDSSGNFWLFGGWGCDSVGSTGPLNDLWKFDGTEWTWINGSELISQVGLYGTPGTADAANVPGGRQYPASWVDSSGNFWLFGGWGRGSTGTENELNDLWRYQP